ncbi:DUF397 domain-containing protein [Actinoallomurus spadix]|uniref:DUF397 domain-containing protein n=1 Tax=Actinoallomurus spadix TaxID=79912 RepID=UPI002092F77C|nr:DUF397 domain-containing protein [Actinoallomurus spadix]MCO5989317.1 DUF397 domain-containing protein [Actinoallomurus spadix]
MDSSSPEWRKSTHSGQEGGECVEAALMWRKSSRSGQEGGQCVEVTVLDEREGRGD